MNNVDNIICTHAKVIFNWNVAKYLLEKKFNLVNIKAHKNTGETVFVFDADHPNGLNIEDEIQNSIIY